mgnify:CR=1 FL=1
MELNDKKREMLEDLIKQMHQMMAEDEEMPQEEEEMEDPQEQPEMQEEPREEEQPEQEEQEGEYPEGEEGEDLKDMLKDFFKNGPGSPDAPAPKVGGLGKKPRGISVTEVEVVASKPKPKRRSYKKKSK